MVIGEESSVNLFGGEDIVVNAFLSLCKGRAFALPSLGCRYRAGHTFLDCPFAMDSTGVFYTCLFLPCVAGAVLPTEVTDLFTDHYRSPDRRQVAGVG